MAKSRKEDSHRPYLNPKIDKGDRQISQRRQRSPLYKPQYRSMNIIMS
ncbi:hypothetical protein [Nostoc sp.]